MITISLASVYWFLFIITLAIIIWSYIDFLREAEHSGGLPMIFFSLVFITIITLLRGIIEICVYISQHVRWS